MIYADCELVFMEFAEKTDAISYEKKFWSVCIL